MAGQRYAMASAHTACDKVGRTGGQVGSQVTARALLDGLFRPAIAAAHPSACLPAHLPEPPRHGRMIVLAAGKAAGSMTEVAEQAYGSLPRERVAGGAVARQG